jgi:F-type H+-transporting ATPase subunit gamma
MGTRDIKRKIKSVNSTMQITKAMELVSTAKLKRSRDRMDITKPYFETVLETVRDLMKDQKMIKHEYLNSREVKSSIYIIITADRGLCGGYNNNAMKLAIEDIHDKSSAKIIAIGKKSRDAFTNREYNVVREYVYISETPQYSDAQEISRYVMKLYAQEEVDEIKLIYTRFISTISQESTMLKLLPIAVQDEETQEEETELGDDESYMTYEPSAEAVLSYVIPKYVESTIFGALVESSAAEQAARRVAMESATDNAEDMIESLTLSFNQARQASITQEISEIVGGAEALK